MVLRLEKLSPSVWSQSVADLISSIIIKGNKRVLNLLYYHFE